MTYRLSSVTDGPTRNRQNRHARVIVYALRQAPGCSNRKQSDRVGTDSGSVTTGADDNGMGLSWSGRSVCTERTVRRLADLRFGWGDMRNDKVNVSS